MRHRPKVAMFSPMPPVPSGISDYTADLLPYLSQRLDLELWVDQAEIDWPQGQPLPIRRWSASLWKRQQAEYDLVIYQVGNSPSHSYMLDAMAVRPGVVVLHDLVLHHLIFWRAVTTGRAQEYQREMAIRYGERGQCVARQMLLGRLPVEAFECPLYEGVVEAAVALGAHSRYVIEKAGPLMGSRTVHHIPMGVPVPTPADKLLARRALGLPESAVLALALGHINPYKGTELLFRVLARLASRESDLRLVVAGSRSPGFPLERLMEVYGVETCVLYLGRVSADLLPLLFSSVDFSFSLRYPTAGETSASLLRALSYGVPAIVTDVGAFSELPDSCCPKVPVGPHAEEVLEAYVSALVAQPGLLRAAGRQARQFVISGHTLVHSANAYFGLIGQVLGEDIEPLECREATVEVPSALNLVPRAVGVSSNPAAWVLDDLAEVAVELGWGRWPGPAAAVLSEGFSDLLPNTESKHV